MGDVRRYLIDPQIIQHWSDTPGKFDYLRVPVVLASDFDAALAREAALKDDIKSLSCIVDECGKELAALRGQLTQHAIAIRDMNVTEAALREELAKTYRSAAELANAMARDVKDLSPEFELFGFTSGVIGQIDNMYAGMRAERDKLKYDLTAAEQRNAELRVLLLKSESSVSYHLMDVKSRIPTTEHKELYRNKVADLQSIAGEIVAALKPIESGASV